MEQAGKETFLERQEGGSFQAGCQTHTVPGKHAWFPVEVFLVENVDGLLDKVRPKNSAAKKRKHLDDGLVDKVRPKNSAAKKK